MWLVCGVACFGTFSVCEIRVMDTHSSFDVVSLFTRVPVDRAIEVANSKLLADETLSDRTALSPKEIIRLLEFCLNATYLCHQGRFFQQTFGTAMGSPVSVTVANLVMEDVETRAISNSTHTPFFWKRYVDDVCTALQKSHVEEFKDHLNTIEPTIQFTVELESNGKLSFLDTDSVQLRTGTLHVLVIFTCRFWNSSRANENTGELSLDTYV